MSTMFYKPTKHLRIRSFQDDDIKDFFQLFTNPQVNSFLGTSQLFSQPHLVKQFLRQILSESTETNPWLLYSVFYKYNHQLIGGCGIKISRKNKEAEIFYLFSPLYWGKGLAAEACCVIINEVFKKFTLKKINALILPENLRAQRVAEKIGFRIIKKIRTNRYEQISNVQLWSLFLITGK